MNSIKQECNFKSHKKISNNMHYRMIRHFSVDLAVVMLVTILMLMPPHIKTWAAEWNGNSGQESNIITPVQETTGPDWNDTCNKISFALISPCSDLVNPDNTLTQQGEHVKGCIQNGAVFSWWCSSIGLSSNCSPFNAAYDCTARRMWRCNKLWCRKP